jgi:hypothetical protein
MWEACAGGDSMKIDSQVNPGFSAFQTDFRRLQVNRAT